MALEAVRLRNPNALNLPPIADLFKKAFCSSPVYPVDYDGALPGFRRMILSDDCWVCLGFDGGTPKALGALEIIPSAIAIPSVLTLYSSGTPELTKTVVSCGVDFLRSRGYNHVWAVNASGHGDAPWMKVIGKPAKVIGSLVEFDLHDAPNPPVGG